MPKPDGVIDPEWERYRRNHPCFPGVDACLDLLCRRNVTGGYLDAVLSDLRAHAAAHVDEVLAAFERESSPRVRVLVLAQIAEAGLERALPLLTGLLTGKDAALRFWAALGLCKLGTREARMAIWTTRRDHQWETAAEAEEFERMLERVRDEAAKN